jgi:hypothetical protein
MADKTLTYSDNAKGGPRFTPDSFMTKLNNRFFSIKWAIVFAQ